MEYCSWSTRTMASSLPWWSVGVLSHAWSLDRVHCCADNVEFCQGVYCFRKSPEIFQWRKHIFVGHIEMHLQLHFQCFIFHFINKMFWWAAWRCACVDVFKIFRCTCKILVTIKTIVRQTQILISTCFLMRLFWTATNRNRGDSYQSFVRNVGIVEPVLERRKQSFGGQHSNVFVFKILDNLETC